MRILDFTDGFTSISGPSVSGIITVSGSTGTPNSIVAGTGISTSGSDIQVQYIQGSGGAVDISASPQISAGSTVGQILILVGCSDSNTVKVDDGSGVSVNGNFTMGNKDTLGLTWNGSVWSEIFRREE